MAKRNEISLTDKQIDIIIREYDNLLEGKLTLQDVADMIGIPANAVWYYACKYAWFKENWKWQKK